MQPWVKPRGRSNRTRLRTGLFFLALASGMALGAAAEKTGPAARKSVLPFVENNYSKALAEARERGVLLFVDAWASW